MNLKQFKTDIPNLIAIMKEKHKIFIINLGLIIGAFCNHSIKKRQASEKKADMF